MVHIGGDGLCQVRIRTGRVLTRKIGDGESASGNLFYRCSQRKGRGEWTFHTIDLIGNDHELKRAHKGRYN